MYLLQYYYYMPTKNQLHKLCTKLMQTFNSCYGFLHDDNLSAYEFFDFPPTTQL